MIAKKLNIYLHTLSKNPEYNEIFGRANQLDKLANSLSTSKNTHNSLMKRCKLGPLSNGQLTLFAENAPIASRLKHTTPSILLSLQSQGWKITSIKVKVSKPANTQQKILPQKKRNATQKSMISQSGIECLNSLASTLSESELKSSIQQLVKSQS